MKDDMKGLGFNKKGDEVTGLAEFSDLLSRLNGTSSKKIEEEKEKRMVFKMNAYVQNRYGAMRFVRGGLLVGDEMKTDKNDEDEEESEEEEEPKETSKKRKAESLVDEEEDSPEEDETERKKRRKEEKKSKKCSSSEEDTNEDLKSKKKDKKSKSRKSKSDTTDEPSKATSTSEDTKSSKSKRKASSSPDSSEDDEPKKSKSERKEEKRARKEQKKKDKEEKKRKKAEAKSLSASASAISSALPSSSASTPAGSGTSTPRPRAHVRSRFLAAKREASSNQAALAKVCSAITLFNEWKTNLCRFGWSRLDLVLVFTKLLYPLDQKDTLSYLHIRRSSVLDFTCLKGLGRETWLYCAEE